ncbi:MAG: HAMP domain-containing protein [Magnetococcales bacterium]|nr:CZB domain-containing protein [Magnetococcales bacterium]NGZ26391.1 HAMP domain-containing protein [Magnetococcales bacterium]
MFRNIRVGVLLFLPVLTLLLTVLLVSWLNYQATNQHNDLWRESLLKSNILLLVVDNARGAQVHFKKQVQEWKNILLRGTDKSKFDKYLKAFEDEEKMVQENLDIVGNSLKEYQFDISMITNLAAAHLDLGKKYREALKQFDPNNPESFRQVDKLVTGMDREPTKQMDAMVDKSLSFASTILDNIETENASRINSHQKFMMGINGLLLLVGLILSYLARQAIINRLRLLGKVVEEMNQGRLTMQMDVSGKPDEIGVLMRDFKAMADNLSHTIRTIILQSETIIAVVTESLGVKKVLTDDAAATYSMAEEVVRENDRLDQLTETLRGDIEQTDQNVNTVAESADELSRNINTIAAAAEEASQNVTTVASAAEEMTANIAEVNENLERVNESVTTVTTAMDDLNRVTDEVRKRCVAASTESGQANHAAQGSAQLMESLVASANEIGKVVDVINSIAEQTNMLALNAAIESAGAGDAGKGFAVVANEVKELARQTAEATNMISERIEDIRRNTAQATEANKGITRSIQRMDSANQEITQSINMQNRTIQEIGRSMERVSKASHEVTRSAREMQHAAEDVSRSAQEAAMGTQEIARSAAFSASAADRVASATTETRLRTEKMATSAQEIFASSAEVQKVGLKVMDLVNYMNGSIHQSGMLSDVVNDTSLNLQRTSHGVEVGKPPFDVKAIKQAHLAWLGRLEQVIRGRTLLKPEEVATGHDCAFGKWYDKEGTSRFGHMPKFQELGRVHMQVHETAREVVRLMVNTKPEEAKQKMEEFNTIRKHLFELLDEVYLDLEAIRIVNS